VGLKKVITSIFARTAVRDTPVRQRSVNLPAKRYFREDLGIEFKSSMEANYYRWIKRLNPEIDIVYEPEIFKFPNNNTGIKAYVPDFRLRNGKHVWYIEVKGHMDILSIDKLRLMRKYYPYVKLYVVGVRAYNLIRNIYSKQAILSYTLAPSSTVR
jgi:hypothetical protein